MTGKPAPPVHEAKGAGLLCNWHDRLSPRTDDPARVTCKRCRAIRARRQARG